MAPAFRGVQEAAQIASEPNPHAQPARPAARARLQPLPPRELLTGSAEQFNPKHWASGLPGNGAAGVPASDGPFLSRWLSAEAHATLPFPAVSQACPELSRRAWPSKGIRAWFFTFPFSWMFLRSKGNKCPCRYS